MPELPEFLYACQVDKSGLSANVAVRCTLTKNEGEDPYWYGEEEGTEVLVNKPGIELDDDGKVVRYSDTNVIYVNMFIAGARAVYTVLSRQHVESHLDAFL